MHAVETSFLLSLSAMRGGGYDGWVNDQTDSQRLRAYAEHRSEPAFAELSSVNVHRSAINRSVRGITESWLAE